MSIPQIRTLVLIFVIKKQKNRGIELAVVGRCQLRKILKQIGMTQTELAELSGKAEAKISDYCNNKAVMSISTAAVIASIVGCKIDDLYEFNLEQWQKK